MLKIIIAGTRDFNDYKFLEETVDEILFQTYAFSHRFSYVEVISGTARGADKLGESYAENRNLQIKRFPAQWNLYGKKAGILRNTEMAKYVYNSKDKGICICFWDGKSKGTANMINTAEQLNIPTYVIDYNSQQWGEEDI
jgi:hypothetical protein